MTDRVRDGVFFSAPAALPRGRHTLDRADVLAAQAERLMIAMTELLADGGWASVSVGSVAARAGVSRAAFYESFPDKESCAFAAYDRFIDVLLAQLAAAAGAGDTWERFMHGIVAAYLGTLQADLVVARAFQVEMDAVGREARERRRAALQRFADFIRSERERRWSARPRLSRAAYVGAVYAARQIASDHLDQEGEPDLAALTPDLVEWIAKSLQPGD